MQNQASVGFGGGAVRAKRGLREGGNPHYLFTVRQRHHSAFQAYAGASGILPGMFPAETASGNGLMLMENL
jgi:hypothetical protein